MSWVYRKEFQYDSSENVYATGMWQVGYVNEKSVFITLHTVAPESYAMRITNYLNGGTGSIPPTDKEAK